MVDQRLIHMEELYLIKRTGPHSYFIVPRNEEWLQKNGLLTYEKISGNDISNKDYQRLLAMPSLEDTEGLETLIKACEESQTVDPAGPDLSPAMCEIYVRLKRLFPEKSNSWVKTETVLYFGRTVN